MGVIKNSWLKRWLYKKEKEFYDEAEKIIALSPDIAINIRSKSKTPVEVIPNMADTEFHRPTLRTAEITKKHPLRILYCGAHGRANHLDYLIEVARASQDLPVHFTLMGAGSEKSRLMSLASNLINITFRDHGNKKEVRKIMATHDAIYVSFQNLKMLHTGSPNKFFDALAGGKMVFTNLDGWIAQLVKEHSLGCSHASDQPDEFATRLKNFLQLPEVEKGEEPVLIGNIKASAVSLSKP